MYFRRLCFLPCHALVSSGFEEMFEAERVRKTGTGQIERQNRTGKKITDCTSPCYVSLAIFRLPASEE